MKKFLVVWLVAGLILPLVVTGSALARDIYEDIIVSGDEFTLAGDETLDGNLIVFGGDVVIEEGATVTKDVVVFGGTAKVAGEVEGDVVLFGGSVDLESTAVVDGRLVTVGGSADREEGAVVSGGESSEFDFDPTVPYVPSYLPFRPVISQEPFFSLAILEGMEVVGKTLALGLIALLVASVWPVPTQRVSNTLVTTPALSGGLGLLTLIAGPVIVIALSITLILIPVAIVGTLLYGVAIVFGWLALGAVLGERLVVALNWRTLNPTLATALGTALLTFVSSLVESIPCVGFMIPIVLSAIGVGAVVLTRFGSQPYLGGNEPPASPALPDSPPAPEPDSGAPTPMSEATPTPNP